MVAKKEVYTKEIPEVDMVMTKDMVEREVYPPHVLILVILVRYHNFIPNYACFVHIIIVLIMSPNTVPSY
jgi:hypothetical protein